MLRKLFANFVRWLVDRWASGQIEEAKKEEEWKESRGSFKDAVRRWRSARRK